MPNTSYYTYKEGSQTYNDSIKILILLLCTFIRQCKDMIIITYITYTTN